jgi:hypothetical protein
MKIGILISFLIFVQFEVFAQLRLLKRDKDEIRFNARRKVEKDLPELLNTLNLDDLGASEQDTLIKNAFSKSFNQVFYDENSIIEDDMSPFTQAASNPSEMLVKKYLNGFVFFYEKSGVPTVEVENVVVGTIEEREGQFYVKVSYSSIFKGLNKITKKTLPLLQRIAELKVVKNEKLWTTYIVSLRNYRETPILPVTNAVKKDSTFQIVILQNQNVKALPKTETFVPYDITKSKNIYKVSEKNFSFVKCFGENIQIGLVGLKNQPKALLVFFNVKQGDNDFWESEDEIIAPRDFHGYLVEPDKDQVFVTSSEPLNYSNQFITATNLIFSTFLADGNAIEYFIPKIVAKCTVIGNSE